MKKVYVKPSAENVKFIANESIAASLEGPTFGFDFESVKLEYAPDGNGNLLVQGTASGIVIKPEADGNFNLNNLDAENAAKLLFIVQSIFDKNYAPGYDCILGVSFHL